MKRFRRIAIGVLAAAMLVAAFVFFWTSHTQRISSDLLEQVLGEVIAGATDGLYGIELGELTVAALEGDLSVADVRIAPRDEAIDRLRETGRLPALRFTLEVAGIVLRGVETRPLLARRGLHAREIEVIVPSIRVIVDPGAAETAPEPIEPELVSDETVPADLATRVDAMLAGIPELRVGSVRIRGASGEIDWRARDNSDEHAALRSVETVDITFTNLNIHQNAGREGFRSLYSDDVTIEASGFDLQRTDSTVVWDLGSLYLSTGARAIELRDIEMDPKATAADYLARPTVAEPDRTSLWVGRARVDGFDFQRLIESIALRADRLEVAGFRLDILNDKRKPSRGPRNDPASMPHDAVRDLGVELDIREVGLTEGVVTYSERVPEAPRPGQIWFEGISGTISNLTNDPARMSAESPARWDIVTRMYGVAPIELQVEMPLLAPPPTMRVSAAVRRFDPTALNAILVPLVGAAIRGGDVYGVAFDLDYGPGRARGLVRAEYEDLRLGPVDRTSGRANVGQSILGFVASNLLIHDDNRTRPGRPARTSRVSYAIDPHDSFFKILWAPVRDGAVSIVKR